jgi:hypothetical protein
MRKNTSGQLKAGACFHAWGEKSIKSAGGIGAKIHFFKIFSISFAATT